MINPRLRSNIEAQRALAEMLHSNWFALRKPETSDPVFTELLSMGLVTEAVILEEPVWLFTKLGLYTARQAVRELS